MRTQLFWIDGPWPGRAAIMPRPRGGDWLEDEVRAWKSAGVDIVVSLLNDDEASELDLGAEPELCQANGVEFLTYPILDRDVPRSVPATLQLARQLEKDLLKGKNVAIHCRQGIGRSAPIGACLLALSGLDPGAAFERIGQARGSRVPDTGEQRAWVERFAQQFQTPLSAER